jgi:endonuclease/exonuclease/phosphatase family metal-dependent hydrolase
MRLLVRTWNVFHGNSSPPQRRGFLEAIVRLAIADRPDVVCLQELPVWSLSRLAAWSGMAAVADVTRRPPLGARLGRWLTALNHGLLRSAVGGQANAVLVSRAFAVRERRSVALNRSGEPRRCQAARIEREATTVVVANVHVDSRSADDELLLAAAFVRDFAEQEEPIVLAGDFNARAAGSTAISVLAGADWQLTGASPTGIDHVLARGLGGAAGEPWPVARRTVAGQVLSDHPPVDRELE